MITDKSGGKASISGKMLLVLASVLLVAGAGIVPDTRQSCSNTRPCEGDGIQLCCDGTCVDWDDGCLGVDGHTLLGIGIAATVAVFVVPILCCCCCGGCALYWVMRRRKERHGQVHQHVGQQPGMQYVVGQDQVFAPGVGQGQQAGGFIVPPQVNTGQKQL